LLTQWRLRDPQPSRGAREAEFFGDCDEVAKVAEIYGGHIGIVS
jgi:hypothetical protein